MTLDEYEQYFLKERAKRRRMKDILMFAAGVVIGQVTGVIALALVSINRGEDDR